jgi:molybdopterin synthase sulfur carrier subunit
MAISVKFFSNFREVTGRKQTTVESAENVGELLDKLIGEFGEKLAGQLYHPGGRKLRETVNILLNGNGVNIPKGLGAPLRNGDTVAIFPPVSGG